MTAMGARSGAPSGLRALVARAMAQEFETFVVPGPDVARAFGLDLSMAGVKPAATPRHASLLLVVGPLPSGLGDAASVVFAQMPRPRVILALGANALSPLPDADVTAPLTQDGLEEGLSEIRAFMAANAFGGKEAEFSAPALETHLQYTCPMHPEIVRDEPGECPKCGMDLVPMETAAGSAHAGHDGAPETSKTMAHASHAGHEQMAREEGAEGTKYTCPMHPEIIRDEPGKCPECGMFLEPVKKEGSQNHSGHAGHSGHGAHAGHEGHSATAVDGIEPGFMSMVELTRDLPRSSDGLQMEWIIVPYGPFFPGLPAGLGLELTLDGDTVSAANAHSLVGSGVALVPAPLPGDKFVANLLATMPLAPVSFGLLGVQAIETANGAKIPPDLAKGRAAALERERIASHLSWLCETGIQAGMPPMARRAAAFQLEVQAADVDAIAKLAPELVRFINELRTSRSLAFRLRGVAVLTSALPHGASLGGPIARAMGDTTDARNASKAYAALGFSPLTRTEGDALARFMLRCDEITQSLQLIAAAGKIIPPVLQTPATRTASATAEVETPRGAARLEIELTNGLVTAAELTTPSHHHIALVGPVADQQELGDALVGVASLDLSPWEARP
jgi:Ni,Fe-hydrogenase III large subunit